MSTHAISGSVTYGTDADSASIVPIPPGATTWSYTVSAPGAGHWIWLENWWTGGSLPPPGSVGCATGTYDNATSGATTHSRSGSLPVCTPVSTYMGVRIWSLDPGPVVGTWSGTITFDDSAGGLCAYGTEKKSSTDTVVDIGAGLIDVLGIAAGAPWAVGAIIASAGSKLYIDHLCTTLPPGDADIVDSDWSTPTSNPFVSVGTEKILNKFNATAWNYFCQCKPATGGGPPPVGPVTVNWNQPTSIVNVYSPRASEVFITNQITNITNVLGGMQTTINNLTTIVNNLHDCSCLDSYVLGTTYAGLVDTGTLVVSDLVGVLVEVIEWPASNSVLVGNPGYLWNMGWMSIDNLNGMLEEKRITREQFVWIPAHMSLATSFRWFAYPGVTLRMTELRAN